MSGTDNSCVGLHFVVHSGADSLCTSAIDLLLDNLFDDGESTIGLFEDNVHGSCNGRVRYSLVDATGAMVFATAVRRFSPH